MDIKIEAPQMQLKENQSRFVNQVLSKRYSVYDFMKAIDVKVKATNEDKYVVSLMTKPEKSNMIFVESSSDDLRKSLRESMKKLDVKIEKYKEVHYHDFHHIQRIDKNS